MKCIQRNIVWHTPRFNPTAIFFSMLLYDLFCILESKDVVYLTDDTTPEIAMGFEKFVIEKLLTVVKHPFERHVSES